MVRADPILGLADDSELISAPFDRDGLLTLGRAHGARFVRTIAYMHSDVPEDRWLQLASVARDHGFPVHAVLALPWSDRQIGVTPGQFAAWASGMAARLRATGVDLRLSILNEPDLLIPAADECDTPAEVRRALAVAGYTTTTQRVRVHKTKVVKRTVRRGGKRIVIRRRVPVYRLVRKVVRRQGKRKVIRIRRPVYVWRARQSLVPTQGSADVIDVSPQRACLAIRRARAAASMLRAAIPAVRAAAPGVPIDGGETSPVTGIEVFLRELARVGIPHVDGWAHHAYPFIGGDRRQIASHEGMFGADRIREYRTLLTDTFGAMPLDITEFGVWRHNTDDATAAEIWRAAYQEACAAGVRELVAYQWRPNPQQWWDTSVLGLGDGPTEVSRQLPTLRC